MSDKQNIRIVDIARLAGVSAGTVDRVIHNRGKVSAQKRALVEKVLQEMNYEPNMAARLLASGKLYSIAVIIPQFKPGSYWELVHRGMQQAGDELRKFNVNLSFFFFNQYSNSSFRRVAGELCRSLFDGVVIASLLSAGTVELSQSLDEMAVPYVYIDSLVENQNNISFFGSDGFSGGVMAAKLLCKEVDKNGDLFFAHIHQSHLSESVQVNARQRGFNHYLRSVNFKGRLHRLDVIPGDRYGNLFRLKQLISHCEGRAGGVIFNSRINELVQIVTSLDEKTQSRISLAGYDAVPENVEYLNSGKVSYLLSQRPEKQGFEAVSGLAGYLLFGNQPEAINYLPIDILIKENVEFYTNFKL